MPLRRSMPGCRAEGDPSEALPSGGTGRQQQEAEAAVVDATCKHASWSEGSSSQPSRMWLNVMGGDLEYGQGNRGKARAFNARVVVVLLIVALSAGVNSQRGAMLSGPQASNRDALLAPGTTSAACVLKTKHDCVCCLVGACLNSFLRHPSNNHAQCRNLFLCAGEKQVGVSLSRGQNQRIPPKTSHPHHQAGIQEGTILLPLLGKPQEMSPVQRIATQGNGVQEFDQNQGVGWGFGGNHVSCCRHWHEALLCWKCHIECTNCC
jgi:hypothetical protein